MPTRKLNSVRKLGTPSVSQAAEAALRGTCTPRPPTPSVPITKLLNRRGLTGAQLLLTLAATKASTLRGCTATSTTSSATSTTTAAVSTASATASTASTAATDTPTPGTTPTTTSTSSTASSTAPSTTLASLALASAAGGEFSSDLLRDFCRGEGILQSFTLPNSPQQNGITERRIGLVMEVARTSMIYAAAPYFLWLFAGPAPSGLSQVDPLLGTVPVEVAGDSGAARGAAYGRAEPGGVETRDVEPGGAACKGDGSGGAEPRGAEPGGSEPGGAGGTGAGGTVRPRPYIVPLLRQVLATPSSLGLTAPLLCPPPDQSQLLLMTASPLPAPSLFTEHREPASRPVTLVRTTCCVPHSRPPPVPVMHAMALRPSSIPLRVPLPPPPVSSLPAVSVPWSDLLRAANPTISRLLATVVSDPSFESTTASALVAELVDFAAACRLNYATALVAESVPASPPSFEGECPLGTDVLEDRQEDFECLAAAVPRFASMLLAPEGDPDAPDIPTPRSYAEVITGPYSSQWQAAMDAEMASWKSTGTYVDAVPPSGANLVDDMWIFRVKRPPGSPPAFKAHYVARGPLPCCRSDAALR
ncbi:unnamed protein product [Closterium sp. NIES-54]